jgi:hypothetical protein
MAASKPVTVEELRTAMLRTIVDRFRGRPLRLETAHAALKLVAYELNVLHIKGMAAPPETKKAPPRPKPKRGKS